MDQNKKSYSYNSFYHVNIKRLYSTLHRYLNLHEKFHKETTYALCYTVKYIFKTSAWKIKLAVTVPLSLTYFASLSLYFQIKSNETINPDKQCG